MTSSERSLLVSTARAYNNSELCEIEVCSILREEFPDKWDQAVQLLMEYVDDYCPELEEVTYVDIVKWRLAVTYTERFLRIHGCAIQNKAEITSCALYMANTMNNDNIKLIQYGNQKFHAFCLCSIPTRL